MGFVLEEPVRVTRRVQVVGVLVLLVLVVAAVLTWRATRPNYDPATAARTAAGVTAFVYTEDWGGEYSAVGGSGRLEVLDGDCLGLADGSLLVFPHGSRVFSSGGQVAVEVSRQNAEGGTKVVRPGDVVGIGGGRPVPIADFGGNLAEHVPPGCGARKATSGIEMYF